MHLGEVISEIRKDKGIKQKELEEIIGVAKGTFSNYETGRFSPSYDMLKKIADALDVSTDYLLERVSSDVNLKLIDSEYVKIGNKIFLSGNVFKRILKLNPKSRLLLIEYIEFLEEKEDKTKKGSF